MADSYLMLVEDSLYYLLEDWMARNRLGKLISWVREQIQEDTDLGSLELKDISIFVLE